MLKRVLLLGIALTSPALFANELASYDAITDALSFGNTVVAVVNMRKCTVIDPNETKTPITTAVVRPETTLYTHNKLTFDAAQYGRAIPNIAPNGIMQRASIILEKNGAYNVDLAFFDAVTNNKLPNMQDVTI